MRPVLLGILIAWSLMTWCLGGLVGAFYLTGRFFKPHIVSNPDVIFGVFVGSLGFTVVALITLRLVLR